VQLYDATTGITTIGAHTYSTAPGTAVQSVAIALDVGAQTLTVIGADGVSVPFTDPRSVSVPAYYSAAEIYYGNAATDGRVEFVNFGADSVIGGRPQTQVSL
jgi:hypothetical protein